MKRYIEHLIEDLEEIKSNAKYNLSVLFHEHEVHDYELCHDDEHLGIKVADLFGIEKFFFPNVDYLTDQEAEKVNDVLLSVYREYGLNPIFESCVTARIQYGHLRNALTHQVFPVKNQMVDIEMCDYLPHYCPMHELCSNHNNHQVCCDRKRRA